MPTSEIFDPSGCESDINFNFPRATFGNYIIDQHKTDTKRFLEEEHITF